MKTITKRHLTTAQKIKAKIMHRNSVRVIVLIVVIAVSTVVLESAKNWHLTLASISAVAYKTIDVLLDVVADRIFPQA
jgi:hypothetical protein